MDGFLFILFIKSERTRTSCLFTENGLLSNKRQGLRHQTGGLVSFVMCAVFGSRPSAVIAVGFTALVLRAILTVLECWVFTQTFIAVVLTAIKVVSTQFATLIAFKAAAVHTVNIVAADRYISTMPAHLLLRLCHNRLRRLRGGVGYLRCAVS